MNKIAIAGCNSFIGNSFAKQFENRSYVLELFSHDPKNSRQKNLFALKKNYNNYDFIYFFSNAKDNKKILLLLSFLSKKYKGKIVYISTTSLYSNYLSSYSRNKISEETIIKNFYKWIIIRAGYVDYYKDTTFSDQFSNFKNNLKIIIGGNLKTHFVYLNNLIIFLNYCLNTNINNKVILASDGFLSICNYYRIKNYKGFLINIPVIKILFLSKIFNFFSFFIPKKIESLLSIYFIDSKKIQLFNNDIHAYESLNKSNFFFRRILFSDYRKYSNLSKKCNFYQIRNFFSSSIANYSLGDYLSVDDKEKFMYHTRINEFLEIKKNTNARNNQKKTF